MTSESVMLGSSVRCFEKPSDILSQGFPWLLAAVSEIPRVPRAHVRALEVSSEGFDQIVPVRDLRRRQMLQPGSGGVREEQEEVVDDEVVIVRSTQLAGQPVVRKPQFRPRFPQVLGDSSRGSKPGRERRPSYGPAEGLRTWWFGQGAPILLAVVASPTPGVVASAHLLVKAGSTVAAVVLVAEATRGCRRRVPRAPGVDRGFPHESGSCYAMLRGAPLPSGGRALGPSDRGVLQEILEFSLDTPPLGGGWLRHRSEQYCRCSQILADPTGSRGQPCPGIVSDTALDVPGLMTRFSGECSACPLLLDVSPELHKLSCFLIELGLHLADLLELCVLTPRRDWDHS
jgi:hypothetical protein